MIRLTVGKFFSFHQNRAYMLDDQQRFAKMLVFASFLHLVLFLSFDFTQKASPKHLSKVDVTLLAPEQDVAFQTQTSSSLPKTMATDGVIYEKPTTKKPVLEQPLRKRTISAASHEDRDTSYLQRWQSYVEHYGNTHYPQVALQNGLRGDLRLLVALKKDGSIHEVSVRSSSGSRLLDQAAIDLVYQAAPFEPLPSEIAIDTEILEIIRTWQFRGELSTS